jgi:hypothetical protein
MGPKEIIHENLCAKIITPFARRFPYVHAPFFRRRDPIQIQQDRPFFTRDQKRRSDDIFIQT